MKHPLINNTRFAIYARLSREDQEEKEYSSSIENQISILEQKLNEMNLECVDLYIDDGYSGKNMNRPGFNRLMDDIYSKKINGVMVKDLSRIGRNLIEVGRFVEEFCTNHFIRVISVLDGYDSAYNDDDDSIVLRSFVNDYYLKECREKQRKAYENRKDKMLFIKHGRYGYDIKDGKLVINQEEAEIIRWIFDEYIKGTKTGDIARSLIKNKVYGIGYLRMLKTGKPCPNEEPYFWNFRSINRIIHDNTYIGEFTNCKNAVYINEYTFKDVHEPIISKEIFELAQDICSSRKTKINEDFAKFLYDGINNRYFRYSSAKKVPRGYFKKTGLPRYKNLSAKFESYHFNLNYDATVEVILSETKEVLTELKNNKNYILELIINIKSEIKPKINKLKEEITRLESKKKNVTSRYISGNMAQIVYQSEKTQIDNKLITLKTELNQLEEKISKNNLSAYNNYVENILSYDQIDMKLARLIFKRVVVTKDEASNPVFEFEYNVKS